MWLSKTSNYIHKIIDPVVKWVMNFGMYALVIMVLVIVADVVMRILAIGVPGLSEVEVFMMVAITFLSIAYVGMRKGHIIIEIFVSRFSAPKMAVASTISDILALVFTAIVVWRSVPYALQNLTKHTAVLEIPLTWSIFLVTLGAGLLCIVILADVLEHLSEVVKSYRQSRVAAKFLVGILIILIPLVIYTIPIWLEWLPWKMSLIATGAVGLVFMLLLMFLGLPIAYAMGVSGFIGISYLSSWPSALSVTGLSPYLTTANYFFIVIPLFILMGSLCATSEGIGANLYNTVHKWLGAVPGVLAMATVGGCAAFGAVCGDTLATVATMGRVSLPKMKEHGYDGALRTGCVAAGGTLGILIPPSIVFIFYAVIAEQSIGELFVAGIVPGVLLAVLMMIIIYVRARMNPAMVADARSSRSTLREKIVSLKGTIEVILLFLLVIGGIYGGLFTPVEAGAIGAFGALIIGLVRRFVGWREISTALLEAAQICGMLLLILIGVGFLATFLGQSHLPAELGEYVAGLGISRWIIFVVIVIMYIILGCIMNIIPAMLLTLPIIMPTILALNFDPVWFGVVMVLMVMIGQITPPVGVACYVTKGMDPEVPLFTVFRGILPFWGCMVAVVAIMAAFPQVALLLPSMMRGG